MLDKLAENHKKWIAIAYNMCKCKDKANDIVQDMYIKMYELNKKNPFQALKILKMAQMEMEDAYVKKRHRSSKKQKGLT